MIAVFFKEFLITASFNQAGRFTVNTLVENTRLVTNSICGHGYLVRKGLVTVPLRSCPDLWAGLHLSRAHYTPQCPLVAVHQTPLFNDGSGSDPAVLVRITYRLQL